MSEAVFKLIDRVEVLNDLCRRTDDTPRDPVGMADLERRINRVVIELGEFDLGALRASLIHAPLPTHVQEVFDALDVLEGPDGTLNGTLPGPEADALQVAWNTYRSVSASAPPAPVSVSLMPPSVRAAVLAALVAAGFEEQSTDPSDLVQATLRKWPVFVDYGTHFSVAAHVLLADGGTSYQSWPVRHLEDAVEAAARHVAACRVEIPRVLLSAGFNAAADNFAKPPLFTLCAPDRNEGLFRICAPVRRIGPNGDYFNTTDAYFLSSVPAACELAANYRRWLSWRGVLAGG